jgi:hypothetical protein
LTPRIRKRFAEGPKIESAILKKRSAAQHQPYWFQLSVQEPRSVGRRRAWTNMMTVMTISALRAFFLSPRSASESYCDARRDGRGCVIREKHVEISKRLGDQTSREMRIATPCSDAIAADELPHLTDLLTQRFEALEHRVVAGSKEARRRRRRAWSWSWIIFDRAEAVGGQGGAPSFQACRGSSRGEV